MREVRIRDTLSGEPRALDPSSEVGIYACGPTVYSRIHIGNARPFVVFSLFARFLCSEGYRTRLVVNVTDVNDKIYVAAEAAGEPSGEFAARMTRAYLEDTDRLGLGRPDAEPLATETIAAIVALIGDLVESGHAYESGGDVYFRVRSFGAYGKLSNRRPEEMDQGEEAGLASLKEDRLDFALWKSHKPGEDSSWDSPWGPGRPAWHIECSVMAEQELGASFAVHGGGSDLVFPHHENEIAQSEAATGKPFSRYWLHNGFVNLAAEKMSKSLGNTLTIKDLVRRHDPEALRFYLLGTHYRHPLEFGDERIVEAGRALARLRALKDEADRIAARGTPAPGPDHGLFDEVAAHRARFEAAMDDDFNTPQALGVLFDLARVLHGAREQVAQGTAGAGAFLLGVGELVMLARVLGLLEGARKEAVVDPQLKARIESLVYLRQEARRQRDFGEADRLRDELSRLGVLIEDTRDGTTWKLQS